MHKNLLLVLIFTLFIISLASADKKEVNVYTHRHYETDQRLFELFTRETGIRVNVVKAEADQLIERLRIEGKNSPADILITVDAGRLHKAKKLGLLRPIKSEILSGNIPSHLRDPDGYWFGLTVRARVIVYHKDRVNPEELSTYEALTDPKWRGKILIRSSNNIYNQSLLASIIAAHGQEAAWEWAQEIVHNMARTPKGNDRDQMKAVAAGIGDLAIVNTYYLGLLLNSANKEERAVGQQMGVFFPNQMDRGTHINISGAGITAASKNQSNAVLFLEFLTSDEVQRIFAEANFEYPVKPGVRISKLLESWGDFQADDSNLSFLGEYNAQTIKIFDEVGWR